MKSFFVHLIGCCAVLTVMAFATPAPVAFKVLVNPANTVSTLPAQGLADVFLKKTSQWPGGERVQPVDLPHGSATRDAFSHSVLGRSASAVAAYWQQQIFSGRSVPPLEVESDAEVVKYVREHAGAVGYVSADAVTTDVKIVPVSH